MIMTVYSRCHMGRAVMCFSLVHDDYSIVRSEYFKMKESGLSKDLVELKAIDFALSHIRKNVRGKYLLQFLYSNDYYTKLFERSNGIWLRDISKSLELVTKLRGDMLEFKNFSLQYSEEHPEVVKLKKLSNDTIFKQKNFLEKRL